MVGAYSVGTSVFIRGLLTACMFGVGTPVVFAQAWVPPARVGVATFAYQFIDNTAHLDAEGTKVRGYDSVSRTFLFNVEYAFTDRFSLSVDLPFVGAKYEGPEPSFFGLPIDECHCWNNGWQDIGMTARYNLQNGAWGVTPSFSIGVPSHDYQATGEAALGRNMNEVRMGIDVGRRLDAITPRLSVSGSYSFAFVQEVINVASNRSNIGLEAAYLASRKLSTRAVFSWQVSHGGLRSTEFDTPVEIIQFDRLIRDNSFHVGGAVSYSFPRFDVFGAYVNYASGSDTHAGHAFTTGLSFPFER
jgi:hypothetical protein